MTLAETIMALVVVVGLIAVIDIAAVVCLGMHREPE